ncbi:hypothetical protein DMC01_03485 [Campylobacter troglodytis]|nr:hypothetical protein DMC01_03485 [Campylobacter troglodytis]
MSVFLLRATCLITANRSLQSFNLQNFVGEKKKILSLKRNRIKTKDLGQKSHQNVLKLIR